MLPPHDSSRQRFRRSFTRAPVSASRRRPCRLSSTVAATAGLALLLAAIPGVPAWARPGCEASEPRSLAGSTLNVRVDNDLFGGIGQDQGYSNGIMVTLVSPNLVDYADDPCLPDIARQLNRYLNWIYPEGVEDQNMVLGIGQALYTPADRERTDLITDDRPYAAALLVSLGYNARSGDRLRTTQLRFGLVGPAARGEQVQNGVHRLIGTDRFNGWNHQLRNEPVLQLIHERRYRWIARPVSNGWGWDAIGHWGASVGNFATYANAGVEWRFGYHVPDDFGSAPLRPAGENSSPVGPKRGRDDWSGHAFVTADARCVLYDITLDGNTFKSSHSVDKRSLVADLGYGVAVTHGPWKLAFARYHRTREFRGQKEVPVFGSVTISRRF